MQARPTFEVTEPAATKLRELAEKKGQAAARIRVKVVSGGCSGMSYKVDFAEGADEKDIVWETRGVEVLLDPMSALYVMNSRMEYSEGLMGSGFKIKNPNASGTCACGESFYV